MEKAVAITVSVERLKELDYARLAPSLLTHPPIIGQVRTLLTEDIIHMPCKTAACFGIEVKCSI